MAFEWDERKRLANLAKHGIDFVAARGVFDGPTLEFPDTRRVYGEERAGAYGSSCHGVLFVVYTWRGPARRLISARKAGTHERELYHAAIAQNGGGYEG